MLYMYRWTQLRKDVTMTVEIDALYWRITSKKKEITLNSTSENLLTKLHVEELEAELYELNNVFAELVYFQFSQRKGDDKMCEKCKGENPNCSEEHKEPPTSGCLGCSWECCGFCNARKKGGK